MVKFRQLLLLTFIMATLVAQGAFAQTNLTQILDTITNPDGTPFNGTVVITWNGYSGSGSGTVSRLSTSARVYNGALSVLLVPTTTASPGTYYLAVYTSSNGTTSWTETWQVPPSTTALTLAAVRQTSTEGSGSTTGSTGTSGGPYATLPIAISQVTNLASSLSSINSTLTTVQGNATTLSTTVNGLNSTVTSQGATLSNLSSTLAGLGTTVSGQTSTLTTLGNTVTAQGTSLTNLSNTVSGLNTTVTSQGTSISNLNTSVGTITSTVNTQGATLTSLSNSLGTLNSTVSGQTTTISNLSSSLGALTTTVAGNTSSIGTVNTEVTGLSTNITTLTNLVNGLNTTVNTLSSNNSTAVFVDDETPSGTANGTNAMFSLANTPAPSSSLSLFRNGLAMQQGNDYTLAGSVITFNSASLPQTGDTLLAYYRMVGTGAPTSFTDNETPGGAINGTNVTFTLASAPNPQASLRLYRNGVLVAQNVEYTLSGSTITFTSARTPQTGDSLAAFYRH